MPVLCHDTHGQVAGVDKQSSADDISVDSVASCATSSFDLDDDPEFVMHRVNFIRDPLATVLTEEHRTPNLAARCLTALHLVPKCFEPVANVA